MMTEHNGIKHNDTLHFDNKYNDTQENDIRHNDTTVKCKMTLIITRLNTMAPYILTLSISKLSLIHSA
jgi:hypothetical protein